MSSYTIAVENIAADILQSYYASAKALFDLGSTPIDLDYIFKIALLHRDRFPGINLQGQHDPRSYIERWVKGYIDAVNNPPSKRVANPKSSCTDPAIRVIVQTTQGFDASQARFGEMTHNLFMSAENIQGNLLEEYIASRIRPYGFLWCDGNVLRAVDFCNSNGTLLIQIKNKSNTENSSSSNIREGTNIEKWYRLGTRTRNGIKIPDYKWENLNYLINTYKTSGINLPPCALSEPDYQAFLTQVATGNHSLITSL